MAKRNFPHASFSWKGGTARAEFDNEIVDVTICGLPAKATIYGQKVLVRLAGMKVSKPFGCGDTTVTLDSPKGGKVTFTARLFLPKGDREKKAHGEDRRCRRVSHGAY